MRQVQGLMEDGEKALAENPSYFIRWYSIKSVALVLTFGALCYVLGTQKK